MGILLREAATPVHMRGHVHAFVSFVHICMCVQVHMCPVLMLSVSGDCGEYL